MYQVKDGFFLTCILCMVFYLQLIGSYEESLAHTSRIPEDSLRVGIITDIHRCTADNINTFSEDKLFQFIRDVDSEETDFNIDLGDKISKRVGKCSKSAEEDLEYMTQTLRTNAPLYAVLGDHDVGGKDSLKLWQEKTNTANLYYSFDRKDVHIVVLDVITGDGKIHEKCKNDTLCQSYEKKLKKSGENIFYRLLYREDQLQENYENRKEVIENSRNKKIRNKGSISDAQLDWLKKDLEQTSKNKVLLFSELPLYYYVREDGKVFDIKNREKLTSILKDFQKSIVAFSADAHTWYEHKEDNIHYYGIASFTYTDGAWALLEWDADGYTLEQKYSQISNEKK